jgi:hypothetical protein
MRRGMGRPVCYMLNSKTGRATPTRIKLADWLSTGAGKAAEGARNLRLTPKPRRHHRQAADRPGQHRRAPERSSDDDGPFGEDPRIGQTRPMGCGRRIPSGGRKNRRGVTAATCLPSCTGLARTPRLGWPKSRSSRKWIRGTTGGAPSVQEWIVAGSQPYHAFPEPGGRIRSREDTKVPAVELRRAVAGAQGHARTCNHDGSGP